MDRFKFRVWSQKYKMYLKDQDYPVGHSIFYISQNGEIIESYDGKNSHDDPDFVVEQCTGLKDRHGKLIFEGDVVDYYAPMADDHYQGVVTFDDNETTASGYYIKGNREGKYDSYLDGSHCRIIGNVHQVEDFGNEKN